MATRLFVGNTPFTVTEAQIHAHFSAAGTVHKVSIVADRETGRPRGFVFIEMDDADAKRALESLDGAEMDGRALNISIAKDRTINAAVPPRSGSRPSKGRRERDW